MSETSSELAGLAAHVASGDHARALAELLLHAAKVPRDSVREAAFRLLAARVIAATTDRAGVARDGLAALKNVGIDLGIVGTADILLIAGLQQDALEALADSYRADPSATNLAHRLGLGELARALRTPAVATDLAVERWTRTLAYLGAALADRRYWAAWCAARGTVYGVALRVEDSREAAHIVATRVRQFLLGQADKAETSNEMRTASALRAVAAEWEADRASVAAAEDALTAMPAATQSPPFPFGPIWFRVMGAPAASTTALAAAISAGEWAKYDRDDRPPDPTAATHGVRLRQWFSRLAPVRMAISNGQLPAAKLALERICPNGEGCAPSARPILPAAIGSPKTCDAGCASFTRCNPGYATLPDRGRALETDAHRLAIRVALAIAGARARSDPPRLIEAAQQWVTGHGLAKVINETDVYAEAMIAQVLGLLGEYRGRSEVEAELLKLACGSVPGNVLQGRLADRLTDRGVDRGNADRWDDAVADFQAALRLNRTSERAKESLGFALKQLAIVQYNDRRFTLAQLSLRDLIALANEHREWAEERVKTWPASDDEDPLDALLKRHGK